jgi:hypothetical protein
MRASAGEVNVASHYSTGTWNPRRDRIWQLLRLLRHSFVKIDPADPVNKEAAEQFVHDEASFRGNVLSCIRASDKALYTQTSNSIKFHVWSDEYDHAMNMVKTWNIRGSEADLNRTALTASRTPKIASSERRSLSPSRNLLRTLRSSSVAQEPLLLLSSVEHVVRHVAKELAINFSSVDRL